MEWFCHSMALSGFKISVLDWFGLFFGLDWFWFSVGLDELVFVLDWIGFGFQLDWICWFLIWFGFGLVFCWIGFCGFFQRSSALIADCPAKVVRFF